MKGVVGIIPARVGSSRFPAKVLADSTGRPLIVHVLEAARRARSLTDVIVATDDARVSAAVSAFGGRAVMTRTDHANGTSRLAQAADELRLVDDVTVVNIQGDEPEIEPDVIDGAVEAMRSGPFDVGTVGTPIRDDAEFADPNVVKVARAADGRALYFSRAPIPFLRAGGVLSERLRHVGIYAYSAGFLRRYSRTPPTPLERCELLEQLRVLETGGTIGVVIRNSPMPGIDTPDQYNAFVRRWRAAH